MSYSWLDFAEVTPAEDGRRVRTHLAKSEDDGATFQFVKEINQAGPTTHVTGEEGYAVNEVSSLVHGPDGWTLIWFNYFEPEGSDGRKDFRIMRSDAANPEDLGEEARGWVRGWALADDISAEHNPADLPELSDCAVMTEPALLSHDGQLYVALSCLYFGLLGRDPSR